MMGPMPISAALLSILWCECGTDIQRRQEDHRDRRLCAHLDEIEIVYGGFRLHARRGGEGILGSRQAGVSALGPAPAIVSQPAPAAPARLDELLADNGVAIRAPMLGIFYRSRSPGEPPFIEVGQSVRADDTVCLVEVMKLFNSISAGVDGVVSHILAENGSMVEYNQVLIVIASDRKS